MSVSQVDAARKAAMGWAQATLAATANAHMAKQAEQLLEKATPKRNDRKKSKGLQDRNYLDRLLTHSCSSGHIRDVYG